MPVNALTVDIQDLDLGMRDIIAELAREDPDHVDTGVLAKEGAELVIIAAANEFGAEINHPGGTPFGFKSKRDIAQNKIRFLKKGTGFLVLGVTKPHKIIIPARSYIRAAIDNNADEILDFATEQARRISRGEIDKRTALDLIGLKIKSLIQLTMVELRDPPNAPSTIRRKGSSNPLIDKSRLFRAIDSVVGSDPGGGADASV